MHQPSGFIAGSKDGACYFVPAMDLYVAPGGHCTDLRVASIIEGVGHWVQQQAPKEVNEALLRFLKGLA